MASSVLRDPVRIGIGARHGATETIDQKVLTCLTFHCCFTTASV